MKKIIAVFLVILFCSSPLQTLANELEEEDVEVIHEEKEVIKEDIADENKNQKQDEIISKDDSIPIIVDEIPYEKSSVSTRAVIGQ
ncbi:hypothetical protein [Aequitasia blattaphilus]|uniref:Uncharacterized protein n=1 Tax=Aequitasia blattaphilus TaxID=2949332 RepID=A0ABT1E574_9FIRM|nr:hypothetical protein [Aequitasia blattaphilus]MCP1100985.1 hypothetical protein [Aequitasia blattaphilus]MCR8613625.1 hypothetical protein [Aequitasia blattaphilus]